MKLSATSLRADIYRLLDDVLETDRPIEIDRAGGTIVIAPKHPGSRLDRLVRREHVVVGDPEDLVSLDWSGDWTP